MGTSRITSVESGNPVQILRMALFHLSTQQWHHSPHDDLKDCHDFISGKLRECQRVEEHEEVKQ
jgi:hypothetical protein